MTAHFAARLETEMRRLTPKKATSMPWRQGLPFGATNGAAQVAVSGCGSALNASLAPTPPRVRAAVVAGAKPSDSRGSRPMATVQRQSDVTEAVSPDRLGAA